jgi:hypothetical protein
MATGEEVRVAGEVDAVMVAEVEAAMGGVAAAVGQEGAARPQRHLEMVARTMGNTGAAAATDVMQRVFN